MSGKELVRCLHRASLPLNASKGAQASHGALASKGTQASHGALASKGTQANHAFRRSFSSYASGGTLFRHASRLAPSCHARNKTTHFGFQDVTEEEKEEKVRGVFEAVASKYDLMNDLMSGGIHRVWKDRFVDVLGPVPGARMLDVAGGTGDIAFRCIKRLTMGRPSDAPHPSNQMTILDLSSNMLAEGQKRADTLGYPGISWVCGNAMDLPFAGDSFDSYTIAFGIRNVVDIPKALSEAHRVLKPGGRFLCLEFSHLTNPALQKVYDQYSFNIIPPLGHVVAGDWDSYQYLVESIRKFPNQEEFSEMIENAGFRRVRHENLTFGVTAIHTGCKL